MSERSVELSDRSRARAFYEQGLVLESDGDPEGALAAFEESYQADPTQRDCFLADEFASPGRMAESNTLLANSGYAGPWA